MVQQLCLAGLPAELTKWQKLEAPLKNAIKTLLVQEHKLIKMGENERTIVAHLASYVRDELKPLNQPWHVDTDYNRVLNSGATKKQPTEYLREAIHWLFDIRKNKQGDLGTYLQRFTESDFDDALKDVAISTNVEAKAQRTITTPDLIVHERTCMALEHNLLAMEFKPSWSNHRYLSLIDLSRMKVFTTDKIEPDREILPTYQHALFLYFTQKNGFDSGWLLQHGNPEPSEFKL